MRQREAVRPGYRAGSTSDDHARAIASGEREHRQGASQARVSLSRTPTRRFSAHSGGVAEHNSHVPAWGSSCSEGFDGRRGSYRSSRLAKASRSPRAKHGHVGTRFAVSASTPSDSHASSRRSAFAAPQSRISSCGRTARHLRRSLMSRASSPNAPSCKIYLRTCSTSRLRTSSRGTLAAPRSVASDISGQAFSLEDGRRPERYRGTDLTREDPNTPSSVVRARTVMRRLIGPTA